MITVHFVGGFKDGEVEAMNGYQDEIKVEVIEPITFDHLGRPIRDSMRSIYRYCHRLGTEDWICKNDGGNTMTNPNLNPFPEKKWQHPELSQESFKLEKEQPDPEKKDPEPDPKEEKKEPDKEED